MIVGPLVLAFIALLLVALALPVLRLIMGVVAMALLVLFIIDVGRGMPVTTLLVDELVRWFQWLYAVLPAVLDHLSP
jgi:membrane protein YdbS with pleckstrin-like domain